MLYSKLWIFFLYKANLINAIHFILLNCFHVWYAAEPSTLVHKFLAEPFSGQFMEMKNVLYQTPQNHSKIKKIFIFTSKITKKIMLYLQLNFKLFQCWKKMNGFMKIFFKIFNSSQVIHLLIRKITFVNLKIWTLIMLQIF